MFSGFSEIYDPLGVISVAVCESLGGDKLPSMQKRIRICAMIGIFELATTKTLDTGHLIYLAEALTSATCNFAVCKDSDIRSRIILRTIAFDILHDAARIFRCALGGFYQNDILRSEYLGRIATPFRSFFRPFDTEMGALRRLASSLPFNMSICRYGRTVKIREAHHGTIKIMEALTSISGVKLIAHIPPFRNFEDKECLTDQSE